MVTFYEVNGTELLIYPHPGQIRAMESPKRFVFVLAGTQSGKTELGPVWLHNEMVRMGSGDYLVVSPSYPLQQKKVVPAYKSYFTRMLGIGEYKAGDRVMPVRSNGDDYTIFFGSADNPDSLESATAKAAHLDEAGQDSFRQGAWEAIQRRLSINQGRVLATTTLYNLGWLKREIYDKWERGDPDIDVIQFDSIENPAFPVDEYERARRTLPDWKFNLFYRGRYARPAGMIYSDFDNKIHIVEQLEMPAEWPRYVGIDPGGVNTALVWVAEDQKRKAYYIYRSSLEGNISTKEHAAKALTKAKFERVVQWVGGAKSETQFRMDWRSEGINVLQPKIYDVESGIDAVVMLLREKRLFILDNNENKSLIDEFGMYSRVLDDAGEPTEKIKDKEEYHKLDATRYILAHISKTRPFSPTSIIR